MPSAQLDAVLPLIAESLGIPVDQLDDALSMGDIPQWDSVSHVNLIVALESAYGLTVTPEMITQLTSIAAIRKEIMDKTQEAPLSGNQDVSS